MDQDKIKCPSGACRLCDRSFRQYAHTDDYLEQAINNLKAGIYDPDLRINSITWVDSNWFDFSIETMEECFEGRPDRKEIASNCIAYNYKKNKTIENDNGK